MTQAWTKHDTAEVELSLRNVRAWLGDIEEAMKSDAATKQIQRLADYAERLAQDWRRLRGIIDAERPEECELAKGK